MEKNYHNKNAHIGVVAAVILIVIVFVLVVSRQNNKEQSYSDISFAMGTVLNMTVYGDSTHIENIQNCIVELDEKKLSWRSEESLVAQMNKKGELEVDDEMLQYLKASYQLSEDTLGAFDITLRPVIATWGIEGDSPGIPASEELSVALEKTGYQKVTFRENVVSLQQDANIDLGAVGKGIALDVAYDYLNANSVSAAMIAAGGSILTYGNKPEGAWKIAIQAPDESTGTAMGYLSLTGTHFISTSGDYEKFFEDSGIRYHHIFDPATGYPAQSGVRSVTVVCDNGLVSDGLSTACFVLGPEGSLNVLAQYGAEAVFVMQDDKVYITDGLKNSLTLQLDRYKMEVFQ